MTEENKAPVVDDKKEVPAATSDHLEPIDKKKEETPAPDPKKEEPPVDDKKDDDAAPKDEPKGYAEHDHPALKQTVEFMKTAGVSVEDSNAIFGDAIEARDVSKVDKAKLVEKVGASQAEVIMVLVNAAAEGYAKQFKEVEDALFPLAGGADGFKAMKEWAVAKEAADPEFAKTLNEIRNDLDNGSLRTKKAAIAELYTLFKDDPTVTIPANLQEGTGTGATSVEPLSRREYVDLVEKAERNKTIDKVGPQLWQRRQAGIKKGI